MTGRVMVVMSWNVWRSSPQREWREWMRRHDLDPACIPIGATITVTEPAHRIEVSHYLRPDRHGHPHFADPRVVQCEATVMPWPQLGGYPSGYSPFDTAPETLAEERA